MFAPLANAQRYALIFFVKPFFLRLISSRNQDGLRPLGSLLVSRAIFCLRKIGKALWLQAKTRPLFRIRDFSKKSRFLFDLKKKGAFKNKRDMYMVREPARGGEGRRGEFMLSTAKVFAISTYLRTPTCGTPNYPSPQFVGNFRFAPEVFRH